MSMNREKAVEVLKSLPVGLLDLNNEQKWDLTEAIDLAIDALAPSNEALTIEQLREMDGKPVYCEELKSWALIYTEGGKWEPHLILPDLSPVISSSVKRHNRTYTLYRGPPERQIDVLAADAVRRAAAENAKAPPARAQPAEREK